MNKEDIQKRLAERKLELKAASARMDLLRANISEVANTIVKLSGKIEELEDLLREPEENIKTD